MGKQRIAAIEDSPRGLRGRFASGEGPIALEGVKVTPLELSSREGAAPLRRYAPVTGRFTLEVISPDAKNGADAELQIVGRR